MGLFPTLMGRFADFVLKGRFTSGKSTGKQPIKKRGIKVLESCSSGPGLQGAREREEAWEEASEAGGLGSVFDWKSSPHRAGETPAGIMLGSVPGRTDFSRISILGPPDFFADFLARFFLLVFVGKSAQKNPPGKSLGKILQNLYNKNPRYISAEGPGQIMWVGEVLIKLSHL